MAGETKETKAETGGIVEKHDKKELSMRYLAALIQYADWIPESYKKLITKNNSVELLQQIYLCACDRVPVEKVQEAQNGKDGVTALVKLRYDYLTKSVKTEYGNELEELRKRMIIAEYKIIAQEHKLKNVPKFGTLHPEDEHPLHKDVTEAKIMLPMHTQKQSIFKRRKESPKDFLSEIIDVYSAQQLQFIMDCIEEGIAIQSIRTFISPVLPVEIMQRLKRLEQEKGGRVKWNKIEK